MKVKTVCDALVLKPNQPHQNFTETTEKIPAGTVLEGQQKFSNGLRRGEPFTYRLFVINGGKVIYLDKVVPMKDNIEVLLNAEGSEVTLTGNNARHYRVSGAILGAIAGFGIAEMKKKPIKTAVIFGVIGAAVGYGVATMLSKKQTTKIK